VSKKVLRAKLEKQEAREIEICADLMKERDAAVAEAAKANADKSTYRELLLLRNAVTQKCTDRVVGAGGKLGNPMLAGNRFANEVQAIKDDRDAALAELAMFKAQCQHRRYTASQNGEVRLCDDCRVTFETSEGEETK